MRNFLEKTIAFLLAAAFICMTACASTQKTGENTMKEKTNTKVQAENINDYAEKSMFAVGEPNTAYAKYFIGNSWLAPLNSEDASIANVTLSPAAATTGTFITVRRRYLSESAEKGGSSSKAKSRKQSTKVTSSAFRLRSSTGTVRRQTAGFRTFR